MASRISFAVAGATGFSLLSPSINCMTPRPSGFLLFLLIHLASLLPTYFLNVFFTDCPSLPFSLLPLVVLE